MSQAATRGLVKLRRVRAWGRHGGAPGLGLLLASSLLLAGCSPAQQARRHPLEWGVFVPDDGAPSSDLSVVASMAGDDPHYVLRFAAIDQAVPIDPLESIADAGRTAILTLEPWIPSAGVQQPGYALARIAAGDHDQALSRWARELAAWDRPLLLRFAHEMNGTWYPWCVGVNGNSANDYVAAWNHVRSVFTSAGADQVAFVWAPNVPSEGTSGFADSYPGPQAVDYIGIDGYNWGGGRTWQEPAALLGEGIAVAHRLAGGKPLLVTEVASAEGRTPGTDKARWIRTLVAYLSQVDGVVGFLWFQAEKERDWRFNSTAQAQTAMRDALGGRPA